ncbi:MAG: hypothetical protein RLP15_07625 [Cryomorphaceae bacterium]
MMVRIFLVISFLSLSFASAAEEGDQNLSLKAKIKQLVLLRQATLEAKTDEDRVEANLDFLRFMRDALQHPESFDTDFDTIPALADLRSGDGFFRLINWNLPYDDGTTRYYCFVQYYDKKLKTNKVVELKKGFRDLEGEYRKVFSDRDWYGCLYYQIIPSKKGRRRKRAYMLLGWDGHDQYSSIKVIDVLTITNRGIRFGADIFDYPYERNIRRFILQYKSDASVSLRYDDRKKRFIFNELVPMQPDLGGMHEFYIPVLEFDAFEWRKRKWKFLEKVEVKANSKDKIYNDPPAEQNLR